MFSYEAKDEAIKEKCGIKINEIFSKLESFDRDLKMPVEYKELKHPQKRTC